MSHYTHAPTKEPTALCGDGQIDAPEECDPYLVDHHTGNIFPDGGCHYAFPGANKLQCIGCHCVGCGNVSTASCWLDCLWKTCTHSLYPVLYTQK